MKVVKNLLKFAYLELQCCIFPICIFIILGITKVFNFPYIKRYDLILVLCILLQFLLIKFKFETLNELKVIILFHLIGLCLEIYKVKVGSWSYPENALFKLYNVPLYSGFMYSSVASYICRAWKIFDLKLLNWPNKLYTYILGFFIYLNFFTNHFIYDYRIFLLCMLLIVFRKTQVIFVLNGKMIRMNVVVSFLLIGFFIWIAENISTFLGAWKYPNQLNQWSMVHFQKITSWFLLIIISVIIIANLKLKKKSETKLIGTKVQVN